MVWYSGYAGTQEWIDKGLQGGGGAFHHTYTTVKLEIKFPESLGLVA